MNDLLVRNDSPYHIERVDNAQSLAGALAPAAFLGSISGIVMASKESGKLIQIPGVREYRMSDFNFDQKFVERGELRERLKRREKLLVIDVRSAEEFASSHIDGAVNIPTDQLAARHGEVPNDVAVVTVCNFGGARSCGAAEQLRGLGYSSALPLRGGIRGWQDDQE